MLPRLERHGGRTFGDRTMTFSSTLDQAGDRFLSIVLQDSLSTKWLTPSDFVKAFSPEVVMTALEAAPELRATILVGAAGVHERIAPKKSTAAATEDLVIALGEGVATPELLLELFSVDDRVRYLSKEVLWSLVTGGSFWTEAGPRPKARMHSLLGTALDQELTSLAELIDAVTPARLASDFPKSLLEGALVRAIESGRSGVAFDARSVFEALPLDQWVEHVPLPLLWSNVVLAIIAPKAGLGGDPGPKGTKKETQESAPATNVGVPPGPPPKKPTKANDAPERTATENDARERALENLARIERMPVRAESLSTPILLAIDAMYAELLATSDEEERAQIIREAFPNATMMEEALFSIVEALDPRLSPEALRARGAEGESLITLVLFEERRRLSGRGPDSVRTPSRPPGPVAPAADAAPPAPVRSSILPPPLPPEMAPRKSGPPPPLPVPSQSKRSG